MARYLVTGAAGFIGGAVAKKLVCEGHEVFSIDNLSTGYRENVPDGVTFYESDCQNLEVYSKLPSSGVDAIFHIAGQSSADISYDDPSYDLRTNTESTLLLLKYAQRVDCRRFIYASTMSVYGVQPDRPINENDSTFPQSFYGVGKLASEHYLRLFESQGIRSTALRLFNVYGPGQNFNNLRQGMVSIFMAQMLRDGAIHVRGSGDRYRDFVYIDDVVEAFLLCLTSPKSEGKIINIGYGEKVLLNILLEKLTALHPYHVPLKFEGNTQGDQFGVCGDHTLAKELLGFEAKFNLSEGLKAMYQWATQKSGTNF